MADLAQCRSRLEVVDGKARYNGRPLANWVDEVVARVFERSDATKVVVFGSVARGDDGPESDIDLLVVLPLVERRHEVAVRILRQLRDLSVPIDLVVVDEASLADRRVSRGSCAWRFERAVCSNVPRDPFEIARFPAAD